MPDQLFDNLAKKLPVLERHIQEFANGEPLPPLAYNYANAIFTMCEALKVLAFGLPEKAMEEEPEHPRIIKGNFPKYS